MTEGQTRQFLPALMGSLRQEAQDGVLVLEQNDGIRHLYWVNGNLVYLKSEAAGEQFGNYLIRQGVLDWDALQELLADQQGTRFGDRLVKWGLLSEQERDDHLYRLMRQILLHAMEHPIEEMRWEEAPVGGQLDLDLYFPLDYRRMVWETFLDLANLSDVCDLFRTSTDWRWEAPPDLLDSLKDLPLTPQMAYALTFLGKDPVGFETLVSLTGMAEEDSARLIVTLWALSGLNLSKGEMPSPARRRKPSQPITPTMVPILPPLSPLPPPATKPPEAKAPVAPPAPAVPAPPMQVRPPVPAAKIQLADGFDPTGDLGTDPDTDPGAPTEESLTPQQSALKLFKRAKYLLIQDRTSETVRLLEEVVKIDPEGPMSYEAWLLLGRVRMANPAWSRRALEAMQCANKLRPNAGEPFALMGELYLRKGFKVEAARNYRKSIELNPLINVPPEVDMTLAEQEPEAPKPEPSVWQRMRSWFAPAGNS